MLNFSHSLIFKRKIDIINIGNNVRKGEIMMSQQEKKELELRCRKFGLDCGYLMRAKTENVLSQFLAFRAHKTIHSLATKR